MRRILILCLLAVGLGTLMTPVAQAGLFRSKNSVKNTPEAQSSSRSKKAEKAAKPKSKAQKSQKAQKPEKAQKAQKAKRAPSTARAQKA
jgi:hypothetical protein